MKRVLALILCLILCVLAIAACAQPEEHTHTYDLTWTRDANGHWFAPSCDCLDAPKQVFQHVDANNDGACDVCTYTEHTHTYSEEWTVDCTNHWHAADCGHTVAGTDVAPHVDEIYDGKCDVCGYVIEDIHEHYYDTEWTYDDTDHWHRALCEHGVEVADKAAHNVNDAGVCTVCDAKVYDVDKTDILAVLKAAIANTDKVVDGTVILEEKVYNGSEKNGTLTLLDAGTLDYFFVLGDGQSYIFTNTFDKNGVYEGGDQQWFERISDDEVFGVQLQHGHYEIEVTTGVAAKLNGYNYMPGSMLAAGYDDTSTLAVTLYSFYDLMQKGVNVNDATEGYDAETGKYSFSYSYFTVNDNISGGELVDTQLALYEAKIEFSINEDFVIDLANFEVKVYNYYDQGNSENDLVYDRENNVVSKTDDANPSYYIYTVNQRSGERTFTSPFPKASLIPTDFELSFVTGTDFNDDGQQYVSSEEPIVDVDGDGIVDLTVEKETFIRLHLGNLIPVSALASALDTSDFEVTYENVVGEGMPWGTSLYQDPTFSGYMDTISFRTQDPGTYRLYIRFGQVTKVITLVIPGEPFVNVPEDTADKIYVKITDNNAWADSKTFTATAAGTYTFTLPAGVGMWITTETVPEFDPNEPGADNTVTHTVSVELAAGKSVTFDVKALEKGICEIGVAFVAGEVEDPDVGGGDDIVVGDISGTYDAVAGSSTGTLTIDDAAKTVTFLYNTYTIEYTYVIENGKVILSNANGVIADSAANMFGKLVLGANGAPESFGYNGYTYTLTLQAPAGGDDEEDPLASLSGTYNGTFYGEPLYVLTFDTTAGTLTVVDNNAGIFTGTYAYSYSADTGITVTGANIVFGVDEDGNVTAAFGAVNTILVAVAGGDDEGGDEDDNVIAPENSDGEFTVNITTTYEFVDLYSFVAPVTGTYTFTVPAGVGFFSKAAHDAWGDAEVGLYSDGGKFSVELTAGVAYEFYVGSAIEAGSYVIAYTDDADQIVYPAVDLNEGDNTVNVIEGQLQNGANCNLWVYDGAVYTIAADGVTITVYDAEGNMLATGDNTVTVELVRDYSNPYTVVLLPAAAGEYTVNVSLSYPEGHYENPEIVTLPATDEVNLPEYGTYYYQFSAGVTGYVTISFNSANMSVSVGDASSEGATTLKFIVIAGETYTVSVFAEAETTDTISMAIEEATLTEDDYKSMIKGAHYLNDGSAIEIVFEEGQYYLLNYYYDYAIWDYAYNYKYTFTLVANEDGSYVLTATPAEEGVPAIGVITMTPDPDYGYIVTIAENGEGGGEEPDNTPDGSIDKPYALEENNSCEFPGGYGYMFYKYTATEAGSLTITATSADFYLGFAYDTNSVENIGAVATHTFSLTAGETIYIGVSTNSGAAGTVTFTATFEASGVGGGEEPDNTPDGSIDKPYALEENNSCEFPGGYGYMFYKYTATEAGSLTITATSADFYLGFAYDANSVENIGAVATHTFSLAAGQTIYIGVSTNSGAAGTVTFTATFAAGSAEPVVQETPMAIGNNAINGADITYAYTASADIKLNLSLTNALDEAALEAVYAVNDGDVLALAAGSNVDVTLAAGDKLVVSITTSGYATLIVTEVVETEGPTLGGSGTSADPWVITTMPYEHTFAGTHDKYFTYTATEDCVLTITTPSGCLVSETGATKNDEGNYVVSLTAGQTLRMNTWSNGGTAPYTYTFTVAAATTPDVGGGDEGGEGGESTGIDGTYYGVGNNGRGMRVVIDTAADTLVITRAQSSSLTNFEGGTTYTLCYSEILAQAVDGVVPGTIQGTSVMNLTFDENGAVVSLVWSGATYTDYVKQ